METYVPKVVTRKVKPQGQENESEFQFCVIDSPEAWPAASDIKSEKLIPIAGKKLRFMLGGISYDDYSDIQHKTHIPEWDTSAGNEPDAGFQARRADALMDRRVALIERGLGKPLPGDDKTEKREFLRQRTQGEIQSLIDFINSHVCCWSSSNTSTPLIQHYNTICEKSVDIVSVDEMLEAWKVASETKYVFLLQRPQDDFITEFPLKGITRDEALRIAKETDPGEPPHMPVRSGKNITSTRPNPNDPGYVMRANKMNKLQLLFYVQACLSFEIPGTTQEEKLTWLGARVIGDLTALKNYIETNILSYENDLTFF